MNKFVTFFHACILSLLIFSYVVADNAIVVSASEVESAVVVVEGYSLGDSMLQAGKDVDISFTLRNTSNTASATNVVMSLSNNEGMLNPKYGSGNQIYVGSISPGATKEVTASVSVSSRFKETSANISVKIDYITLNNQRTNSVDIFIPATGGTVISINSVSVSPRATVKGKTLISVEYTNNTGADILDAKLLIDGNISDDSKELSVGTISAGRHYSKDLYVVFTEVGDEQISISFSYSVGEGESKLIDLGNYNVRVSEAKNTTNTDEAVDYRFVLIGRIIALLAGCVALLVLIGYVKKK
ncbi:hypothetical protein [Butyrivibrio sp. YAB3001]|uniref:hypothetical protein n=1 Tax=Butyrivibrio sp. YAB3001 TaxID=1520812 RepID=UPI0008F67572|nr:hypothetical protein [Butyrivibrio sp. YAB3001]SFC62169.1 hypothetical protein SAMN02910398_02726 [Butyrivibrio sp. YAB3001]